MKSNLAMALLIGALILACATNAFMSVRYFFSVKELEKLQAHIFRTSRVLNTFEGLLNQSLAYGKENPAILPLIDQLQSKIQLRTNNPAFPPAQPNPAAPLAPLEP